MKALVFNLRVISVENQLILEEGSERGFLFTYWRLIRHPRILGGGGGAELIISLARKARKLKPGDSNNTATCKSVVGTSHIAAVYHIAMGQFTANTNYHWQHIIMKWMEMRNITFDKSAMMRVKYFILQWAGDVLLCIVIVLTFLTLLWSRAKLAAGTKLDPGE